MVCAITATAQSKPLVKKTVESSAVSSSEFIATAYALKGKMANGQSTHAGAVAADPRVLPIGSVIYIEGMGQFVVKDTGGAIKGRRLDIWFSSISKAFAFGKRAVKVRIISKPHK